MSRSGSLVLEQCIEKGEAVHLNDSQARRFYRLLNALAIETDRSVCITEKGLDSPSATQEDQFDVLRAIAEESGFVDDFVSNAPFALSKQDEAVLDQWHNLWHSGFYLTGFAENGNALLSTAIGMVEVTGITQEISEIIDAPGLISTVLMPFEDVITFGVSLIAHPVSIGSDMQKILDDELAANAEKPPIRTADEFIAAYVPYLEKKLEEDWQEFQRKLAREDDKRRGVEQMPEGLHRGSLAGLTPEQRAAAVSRCEAERLRQVVGKLVDQMRAYAIANPPRGTLSDALADFKKADLLDMAKALPGVGAYPSWKKHRIVDAIAASLTTEDKNHSRLLNDVTLMPDSEYEQFVEIVDAGGVVEMSAQDERLFAWLDDPPYIFLYRGSNGDTFSFAVMPEVREAFLSLDRNTIERARDLAALIGHAARLCADFYGMVPIDEVTSMFNSCYEAPFSVSEMQELVFSYWSEIESGFAITFEGDGLFVCDPSLSLELQDLALGDGKDGGRGNEGDSSSDESREGLVAYREYLLQRHLDVPRRPFDEIERYDSVYDCAMQLESAALLRSWLDAHVPDGEDDVFFADDPMSDIVFECQGGVNPSAVPQLLSEVGLFCDMDQIEDLLALVMRFANDVPCWQNNGYSPNQLLEMETGRRMFYNEDGRPAKVGRNDPCPCGSGKKYKKCCGR